MQGEINISHFHVRKLSSKAMEGFTQMHSRVGTVPESESELGLLVQGSIKPQM